MCTSRLQVSSVFNSTTKNEFGRISLIALACSYYCLISLLYFYYYVIALRPLFQDVFDSIDIRHIKSDLQVEHEHLCISESFHGACSNAPLIDTLAFIVFGQRWVELIRGHDI